MRRRVVLGLLATGSLGSCGVPTNGTTVPIEATDVPYGLASSTPSTTTPDGPTAATGPTTAQVFFLDADLVLVPVPADGPGQVQDLLDQLAQGPDAEQRNLGFQSALGPDVTLSADPVQNGVVTVEVVALAQDPSADRLPLAVGQIVLSLTSVPGVRGVMLQRDGQAREVPLPGGVLTSRVLTAQDYLSLTVPG